MSYDVLVINANPLLNLVHLGDYTPATVNRVGAMPMVAEGKGVNVARVLARHGYRVALSGFAGGHSGAWLRSLIKADGVSDALVTTAASLRVGFMAAGQEGHPTTIFPGGFAVTTLEYQTLLQCCESLLGAGIRLVIASGSLPHPVANPLYAQLLQLCVRYDAPCWLDAYGPAMQIALASDFAPALCKPNRQELASSLGWERALELHITDGAQSVEIRSQREGHWQVLPPPVQQVNPVGSGDCYVAGLAHGWLADMDFVSRVHYAVSAGAANAVRQDVAMIGREEIESLVPEVRVKCCE